MAGNGRKTAIYHSLSFPNSLYFEKKKFGKQNYLFTTSFLPLNCPSLKICFMKKGHHLTFLKRL